MEKSYKLVSSSQKKLPALVYLRKRQSSEGIMVMRLPNTVLGSVICTQQLNVEKQIIYDYRLKY